MTTRPDVGDGISTKYRGETDTFDVFRNGTHIGVVDPTRDCTGEAWAICDSDPIRERCTDPNAALVYVVANAPECLDGPDGCSGNVEYRMALSGTGRSFPRCDKHWHERLKVQEGINRRYPVMQPDDWSPYDAGESWDEDY